VVAMVSTAGRKRRPSPALIASLDVGEFLGHSFFQIHGHDYTGLNCRTERCDIANPDGHAEVEAHEMLHSTPPVSAKCTARITCATSANGEERDHEQLENDLQLLGTTLLDECAD
jgi:hypothetical protein